MDVAAPADSLPSTLVLAQSVHLLSALAIGDEFGVETENFDPHIGGVQHDFDASIPFALRNEYYDLYAFLPPV
jgi:hypothetical protein